MEYEILDNNEPTPQEQQEAYETWEAVKTLPTIAERKDTVKRGIKEQVLQGYLNPLEFYRQAKIAIDVFEELKKDADIFECAVNEIDKYGKEKAKINDCVVDYSSRTTYDYKGCNDSVWNELKEKLAAREKFLKAIPPQGVVDPESGEVIMPPSVKVSNFITVKL